MTDAPGSNTATRETALLEALWRGDELAAALKAATDELAAARRRLARAEETIAALSELGDAAQAAIDELRRRVAEAEEAMQLFLGQRDAVAAELFAVAQGLEAAAARAAPRPWWRRALRRLRAAG
jgi:chromosome segregation ATPase